MDKDNLKHDTPTDANNVLAEVVSWGKDKIINLLLVNRGYLMSWDYNSQTKHLAERFITWCESRRVCPYDFR
jgi:hypothetical protein